jgi:hypothetical protein
MRRPRTRHTLGRASSGSGSGSLRCSDLGPPAPARGRAPTAGVCRLLGRGAGSAGDHSLALQPCKESSDPLVPLSRAPRTLESGHWRGVRSGLRVRSSGDWAPGETVDREINENTPRVACTRSPRPEDAVWFGCAPRGERCFITLWSASCLRRVMRMSTTQVARLWANACEGSHRHQSAICCRSMRGPSSKKSRIAERRIHACSEGTVGACGASRLPELAAAKNSAAGPWP